MQHYFVAGATLVALSVSAAMADFSYQEKATVTGGVAASAMKLAGVFSKQAREPVVTTVSVKGDKMVNRTPNHTTVIDLEAQTFTSIDLQKKTYSVMTFDEMKQMMEQAAQKMKQNDTNASFKVSVKATGNAKPIGGLDAKEMTVKMEMEATDQQSGRSGGMVIDMDVWLAPSVPGYQEVRDFNRRLAAKLNWTPGSQMAMGQANVAKGMAEAYKEVSKLDGVPVYETITMNGQSQPGATQQPAPRPSLGSALGLGRTKQSSSDSPQAPPSLMEMTRELSAFSAGPVDDAEFAVPAGFKKVEPDQRRGAR
jgi:transcriptional regulator of acetoin/glycerol metabolism